MMRNIHGLVIFLLLFAACVLTDHNVKAASVNSLVLTVKVSPAAKKETQLTWNNRNIFKYITKSKSRKTVNDLPVTDTYLTLQGDGVHLTYLVDRKGDLFNELNKEMIELPTNMKTKLLRHAEKLRSAHYGEMWPWLKAQDQLPLQSKFKVIDMETGLAFNVQRRAGKKHADVQPLTKEDTAIMKQIYSGAWSWKRKAILVQTEGGQLAASMNGMPHGGRGIAGNGFPGHFCIHFLGSTTHRKGKIDPEHQLMIRKAAGNIDEYLNQVSAYETADTFVNAFNLKDVQILKMLFTSSNQNQLLDILQNEKQITKIRKSADYVQKDTSGLLALELPVQVTLHLEDMRQQKTTYTFDMVRTSLTAPWKINFIRFDVDKNTFPAKNKKGKLREGHG